MATEKAAARPRRRARGVAVDLQLPLSRAEEALREQARRYLAQAKPTELARAAIADGTGFDAGLWQELAELEWIGILIPEAHGGAGGTMLEATLLAEEIGRALHPGPFLSTAVLAAVALRETRPERLPELAGGSVRAAVALAPGLVVRGGSASGRATGVLEADGAGLLLLAAAGDGGAPLLVAADAPAAGITVSREPSLDESRSTCTLELADAAVEVLAEGDAAETAIAEVETAGAVALAAELLGGAAHCLATTVDYAGNRIQFGKPIGAYQAVKHACVDVMIEVEATRAAVRHAARLVDAGDPDRRLVARLALVQARRTLRSAAASSIQLHGGAGFTWDNDAHLYLKREKASERLLDAPWQDVQTIAAALGF